MALLSGLDAAAKNTPFTVTLDKATLFALAPVVADAYFLVQANVQYARVIYRSSVGGQEKDMLFDLSQSSPSVTVLFTEKARDSFLLQRIVLMDFDGDVLTIGKADLPTGLDMALVPPPPPPASYQLLATNKPDYMRVSGQTLKQVLVSLNNPIELGSKFQMQESGSISRIGLFGHIMEPVPAGLAFKAKIYAVDPNTGEMGTLLGQSAPVDPQTFSDSWNNADVYLNFASPIAVTAYQYIWVGIEFTEGQTPLNEYGLIFQCFDSSVDIGSSLRFGDGAVGYNNNPYRQYYIGLYQAV